MTIIDKYRKSESDKKHKAATERSIDFYQIKEFQGEIWLTYMGFLVCPCSMLKDDPVEAIRKMRELFVQRNT